MLLLGWRASSAPSPAQDRDLNRYHACGHPVDPVPMLLSYTVYLYYHWLTDEHARARPRGGMHYSILSLAQGAHRWPAHFRSISVSRTVHIRDPMHACACSRVSEAPQSSPRGATLASHTVLHALSFVTHGKTLPRFRVARASKVAYDGGLWTGCLRSTTRTRARVSRECSAYGGGRRPFGDG